MASRDYVRDLNNFLQGHPTGNLTPFLQFQSEQTGPINQPTHQGRFIFRGMIVGTGSGVAIGVARRAAAIQALDYFRTRGVPGANT